MDSKKEQVVEKSNLHPRSLHKEPYDFKALIATLPELSQFVGPNKYGNESINFFDPVAVKALNKALLMHFYKISFWDIPKDYLTPPIPSRADYLHYVADLLGAEKKGIIPLGKKIAVLDIGVGANCIYPLVGHQIYGWTFVGSDIDIKALEAASKIIKQNKNLSEVIELRLQKESTAYFNVIGQQERFDLSICNPPFHSSLEEARAVSTRKIKNLTAKRVKNPILNFGGMSNELWCEGGEKTFLLNMIKESLRYRSACFWFTTIVSKETLLQQCYSALKKTGALEVRTIPMGTGNKKSRILAWTYLSPKQQKEWMLSKWEATEI